MRGFIIESTNLTQLPRSDIDFYVRNDASSTLELRRDMICIIDAIVHSPDFEAAILKIINGEEEELTLAEERTISAFLINKEIEEER